MPPEDTSPLANIEVLPHEDIIDRGSYILEKNEFTESKEGFYFYSCQYKNENPEEAQASVNTAVERYGASKVVNLINTALASQLRIKAANSLPGFNDPADQEREWAKLKLSKPCRISPEEAESHIPGDRTPSIQSILREAGKLLAKGAKGDMKSLSEGMSLMERAQKLAAQEVASQVAAANNN